MQHEQHGAERERRCAGKKWHEEQRCSRYLERAGEIPKPLANADVVKEHDHVVPANELRSANEKEHRRERDFGELDEPAITVHPYQGVRVRLAPTSQRVSRQPRPQIVERHNENEDTDYLCQTDMVQHCLNLRARKKTW